MMPLLSLLFFGLPNGTHVANIDRFRIENNRVQFFAGIAICIKC